MTSCPTPVGQQAGGVLFEILRLYQGSLTFCLYQVKLMSCLYQGVVYPYTSVRGAASAWAADIRLSSDCDGVYVTAFVKSVVWEMTLAAAGWYRLSPIL